MATQDVGLNGKVGNLIYFKRNGKTFVRAVPKRVRQTKETKAAASIFGAASTIGSLIRGVISPMLPNKEDRNMQIRLVGAVFQWLKTHKETVVKAGEAQIIKGFSLTGKGPGVLSRWKVNPKISYPSSNLLQIDIPSFIPSEMKAPQDTVAAIIRIAGGVADLNKMLIGESCSFEMRLPYDNRRIGEQKIEFNLQIPSESLLVVGIAIEYRVVKTRYESINQNKRYMPAGIVQAIYIP